MSKTSLALIIPALVIPLTVLNLGPATAQSAHNAQTGAQTANASDTAQTACAKQWGRTCAKADPEPARPLRAALGRPATPATIIASSTLSADALDRIQNEN